MDIHGNVTEYLHQPISVNVPRDIIHLNKQILSADADASREKVMLEFQDGTVVTASLLLGANRLRSVCHCSLHLLFKANQLTSPRA